MTAEHLIERNKTILFENKHGIVMNSVDPKWPLVVAVPWNAPSSWHKSLKEAKLRLKPAPGIPIHR